MQIQTETLISEVNLKWREEETSACDKKIGRPWHFSRNVRAYSRKGHIHPSTPQFSPSIIPVQPSIIPPYACQQNG